MNKLIKPVTLVAILILSLFSFLYFAHKDLFIAATVNGKPITRLSVIQQLEKKAGPHILDEIIAEKLINEAAANAGVVVSEAEIDGEMDKFKEKLKGEGIPFEEIFNRQGGQGLTEVEFRANIASRKRLEHLLKQVVGDAVAVTDAEVDIHLTRSDGFVPKAVPKGMTKEDFVKQAREQLQERKFDVEASKWLAEARSKSDIKLFVWYGVAHSAP